MVHPVFALYAAQYCSQVLPALPIVFLYQALHYTSDTYFFLIIASRKVLLCVAYLPKDFTSNISKYQQRPIKG